MKILPRFKHRGSIMVTLLLMVSVLALLVATVATDSLQTLKTTNQSGRDSQAKYAAYAGMEMVMNELRKNEQYHGDPGKTINENHGQKVDGLKELSHVSFDVLIWNNMQERSSSSGSGSEPKAIEGPGDILVQPDTVYMVSTGRDNIKGQDVVLTSMAGTARRVRPVFEDAAFGRSKIMVQGSTLIDAWDSGGGWTPYVKGEFPDYKAPDDSNNSSENNNDPNYEKPTVSNFEATLGTDNKLGRTLRLLGDSKLNGFFRIGPGAAGPAYTSDSGEKSSSSSFGGDSSDTAVFGVSTAKNAELQIAGKKGSMHPEDRCAKVDDKTTDMPRFVAPYDAGDLSPPPPVANPPREEEQWSNGQKVTVQVPPAPVKLAPGGYESINVPGDQTLELSPGVYYFKEGMEVSGKIKLTGGDPVIVFVGEKAVFDGAKINEDGKTSSLQLCFTDELTDEAEVKSVVNRVKGFFDAPSSSTVDDESPLPSSAGGLEGYVHNLLAPARDPKDPKVREGMSLLDMTGGSFHGSISGKNLVTITSGANIFGGMMANVISVQGGSIHQDLALKGSNLMNAGGWSLEGVHQVR